MATGGLVTSGLLLALLVLLVLPAVLGAGVDRLAGGRFATRSEVYARRAMAATSQPIAAQAALTVLVQGGSAVDGAIAANAALAVVEPTGCGPGGDLFALVWDPDARELVGLDASGASPRDLSLAHLRGLGLATIPERGPLSVSVPGCVDGWFRLHERFGRLSMHDVLAPAIDLARHGFGLSPTIALLWARGAAALQGAPGFAATFLPHGRAPRRGDVVQRPALARTLEVLAAEGRDAFYRGDLARRLDGFCRGAQAFLRLEDLATHAGRWVAPVATTYRGHEVWAIPPGASGIAALQMLNLLEPYDLAGMGFGSADHVHHLVEAKKIAYEDRARWYADPAFVAVPTARLTSKAYATQRRSLLDPARAARALAPGDPRLADGDTVCLAVADERRMMVSLMQSNYRGFGSGLCPPDLGFGLQNRGCLFALADDHPNVYAPGKRPFHTIMPGFVTRERRPVLAFGVMGGDMQPQGQVQILLDLVDFGMDLQEASDAPRVWHTGSSEPTGVAMEEGGTLTLERAFAPDVVSELVRRGHRIGSAVGHFGGCQAVGYDAAQDVLVGASESRLDGHAAGF